MSHSIDENKQENDDSEVFHLAYRDKLREALLGSEELFHHTRTGAMFPPPK